MLSPWYRKNVIHVSYFILLDRQKRVNRAPLPTSSPPLALAGCSSGIRARDPSSLSSKLSEFLPGEEYGSGERQ